MKYLLFSAIIINASLQAAKIKLLDGKSLNGSALLDSETDTLGMAPPKGADVLLAPSKGLEKWQLRPVKVGWMSAYEEGKLQWSINSVPSAQHQ